MSGDLTHLRGVIFDWAGTTVDHGSRAPVLALVELFRRHDIVVELAAAREPMGMAKRDHIRALAVSPTVAAAWKARHGKPVDEADVDVLYAEFLPLQDRVLRDHGDVIAGVPEMVVECRRMGLRIGSTTGYTRALMEIVSAAAKPHGYVPDCIVGADDMRRGRPAPFLLFEAAHRMDVYPMAALVAVDDTPVGIEAGRNAGCWTIGVTRTGNLVGFSAQEVAAQPEETSRRTGAVAGDRLRSVGKSLRRRIGGEDILHRSLPTSTRGFAEAICRLTTDGPGHTFGSTCEFGSAAVAGRHQVCKSRIQVGTTKIDVTIPITEPISKPTSSPW